VRLIKDSNLTVTKPAGLTLNSDSYCMLPVSPETGILKRLFDFVLQKNNL